MADPQRPGVKLGARTEFLVIGDIIPGHEGELRHILDEHMARPRAQQEIDEIGILHEARFTLIDGGSRLVYCGSFDGSWDAYVECFAATAIGRDYESIWQHIQGYPGSRSPALKDWFAAHQLEAGNYLCAYPKASVKQIWYALAVQRAFDQVLQSPRAGEALEHPALQPLLQFAAD